MLAIVLLLLLLLPFWGLNHALQEVALATGVLLDSVYSGKALHADADFTAAATAAAIASMHNLTQQEVALATGVLLDPVYSGKALHALLSDMRAAPEQWSGKKVLFVHTGGLLVSV
jgi:1-aminocyclopropane-1-carboxylate deaminase/D-cysteine desulfhydrase-like pyridoxal-dependent ACC family enzyme